MTLTSPTTLEHTSDQRNEAQRTVTVIAWRDATIESHPASRPTASQETLWFWTPILGPTATLMAHRLAGLVSSGETHTFTVGALARTFGLGTSTSRVQATLDRLQRFGVIVVNGDTIAVRIALGPLSNRHRSRLPERLAGIYEQMIEQSRGDRSSSDAPASAD